MDPAGTACDGLSAVGASCGGGEAGVTSTVEAVINILLFIVGVAAVVMLIVGGLRYITSGGDAQAATAAKNTVLYSIIGLIVAVLAYALVDYVFGKL
jgi:hypothetical protein